MSRFSDTLRKARERRGLKQQHIAETLGITHGHVSQLEVGYAAPRNTDLILEIASVLDDDSLIRVAIEDTGVIRLVLNNEFQREAAVAFAHFWKNMGKEDAEALVAFCNSRNSADPI